MKKHNKTLWISIIIMCILFVLEINKGIFTYATLINNFVRENVFNIKDNISLAFDKYIYQAEEIENLGNVKLQNERLQARLLTLESENKKLLTLLNINKKPNLPDIFLVKAYSYVNMGNYSQIWLKSDEFSNTDENKIFGLIRNGYAAGVALNSNGGLVGILNGDSKASYSVYIGDSKSVGILKNNTNGNIAIEYINAWNEIKIGDEVVTSGLDGIFFEGIKVGKIKKVSQEYGYIVAEVDLYNQNNDIGYFWLIDISMPIEDSIDDSN